MFLTLGLPAHVAAAHRHEFSAPRQNHQSSPRSSSSYSRPSLSRPVSWPAPPESVPAAAVSARPESQYLAAAPAAASSSSSSKPSAMASEDDVDVSSEAASSRPASLVSIDSPSLAECRPGLAARPRRCFQLAHPPPAVIHRQRLHIRPRLLLQLQRLAPSGRPQPALDVLSSTIFAPKLVRSLPKFLRGKDGLGPDDLVVVKSDRYGPEGSAAEHDEDGAEDSRHVVATICPARPEARAAGQVEICLDHGPLWEGRRLPSGGYQFDAVDDSGAATTVRWVPRPSRRYANGNRTERVASSKERPRFGFSVIDPRSRRHPILATLTRRAIDVLEAYPDCHGAPRGEARGQASPTGQGAGAPGREEASGPEMVAMDEALRSLILVTGIWLTFQEGWSHGCRQEDRARPSQSGAAAVLASPATRRSISMPSGEAKHSRIRSLDAQSLPDGTAGSARRLSRLGQATADSAPPSPADERAGLRRIPSLSDMPRRPISVGGSSGSRQSSRPARPSRRVSSLIYPPTIVDGDEDDDATGSAKPPSSTRPLPPTRSQSGPVTVDECRTEARRDARQRDGQAAAALASTETAFSSAEGRQRDTTRRRWSKLKHVLHVLHL